MTRYSSGWASYREENSIPALIVGYRRAFRKADRPLNTLYECVLDKPLVGLQDFFGIGYKVGQKIIAEMQPLPDAIVSHSDLWAMGIIKALRDHGVQLPEDVAVIEFGDEIFLSPPLTSLAVPVREIAEAATTAMFQKITDAAGAPSPLKRMYFKCGLVARNGQTP